jgi:Flp pilus assembly protein TadG
MNSRNNERGQAIVLTVLALTVLVGMCAVVLDVGAWFRTDRRLQQTADAAALAGAQDLPDNPTLAKTTALNYADKNGGDVAGADIVVTSTFQPNDTIAVTAKKSEVGIFSKIFGVTATNISAGAKARVGPPAQALHVAPMTVYCGHPKIHDCDGSSTPDFGPGNPTWMEFDKMGAPGAFGMLDLSDGVVEGGGQGGGTPGTSEQAEWILRGHSQYLGLGKYQSNPGAKFSSSQIQEALSLRVGTVLLFPVFRTLEGEGSSAQYDIIGWIGFHLLDYKIQGHSALLYGYFTEFIAQGVQAGGGGGSGSPSSFGVKVIHLIE